MTQNFVHIHLHTDASILDGFCQPDDYAEKASKLGFKSIAITDHGNLNNTYKFYRACVKNKIKPIIGCEFYTNEKIGLKNKEGKRLDARKNHILALAKNEIGWKNLIKLNHISFSENNFYYKPTISLQDLINHKEGLIVSTACIKSLVGDYILEKDYDSAERVIERLHLEFKEDFYVEIMLNELKDQEIVNKHLIDMAKKMGIKIILSNDVHYSDKGDSKIQDVLLAINRKTTLGSENAFSIDVKNIHLATREEFHEFNKKFGYNYDDSFIDKCLDNTNEIDKKVDFTFPKTKNFPVFHMDEKTAKKYGINKDEKYKLLVKICVDGFREKIGKSMIVESKKAEYESKMKFELGIIKKMGYVDYFLMVWDIINYARENGIRRGVARGSVGGSVVAFLMKITDLDAVKWETIFERFISVDRYDYPDIDMDFDIERRDEIFAYLKSKYNNVASIGTTQNFGVKNIIRDFVRVDSWAKSDCVLAYEIGDAMPSVNASTKDFDDYLNAHPDLWEKLPKLQMLKKVVHKLHGSIRSMGKHASGICIIDKPLSELLPINRSNDVIVTAFQEGNDRELSDLGVAKFDILGLKTVSIIDRTIKTIRSRINGDEKADKIEDDFERLNWVEDKALLKDLKSDNLGIFQFDAEKNYGFLLKLDPLNFRHVVDSTSLYRPDILRSGQSNAYIQRKNGTEIPPRHLIKNPVMKEIIGSTYYTFVYQEQIMFLLHKIFGLSMADANLARKYISKKKEDDLKKLLNTKMQEILARDGQEKVEELKEFVDMMLQFGGYSFNFAHAVAYTLISMQCVYLKHHYPLEFFTTLINFSINDEDKLDRIFCSAAKYRIQILPPDINKSSYEFKIEGDRSIRAGFNIIGGMSFRSFGEIERERKSSSNGFTSVSDFLYSNFDWGFINKAIMTALIQTGCFDSIDSNRKKVFEIYKEFSEKKKKVLKKENAKQTEMFSKDVFKNMMNERMTLSDIKVEDYTQDEKITFEEKHFGFIYWLDIFKDYRPHLNVLRMKHLLCDSFAPVKGKYILAYVKDIKYITSNKSKAGPKEFIIVSFIDSANKKAEFIFSDKENFTEVGIKRKGVFLLEMDSYKVWPTKEERFMIGRAKPAIKGEVA